MLKINKKVEYALIALKFMATQKRDDQQDPKLTTAREVCDHFNTPFDTTAKVMQRMNAHNILNSVKGIKGGYSLARPLNEITYIDLINIVEGERGENICQTPRGLCECHEYCNIKSPVEDLNRKLHEYLERLTLEELLLKSTSLTSISSAIPVSQECPGEQLGKRV